MKKGGSSKGSSKPKGAMSVDEHRKLAQTHHAKARLHNAKAELMEAQNPPKKGKGSYPSCY